MRQARRDTIKVTPKGNIIVHAGDILQDEEDPDQKIQSKNGRPPDDQDQLWAAGRPLEVIAGEKRTLVSRARLVRDNSDMDHMLPKEIRQRRQNLVKARMREERQ